MAANPADPEAIANLLTLAEAYAAATGVSESTISGLVLNGGNRLRDIRAGADIGSRRVDRAIAWFSQHWPAAPAWPKHIRRPSSVEPAA